MRRQPFYEPGERPFHCAKSGHYGCRCECRMCRCRPVDYAEGTWRTFRQHLLCFDCRRSWKTSKSVMVHSVRYDPDDHVLAIDDMRDVASANSFCCIACPSCGKDSFVPGRNFRAPKHRDAKAWAVAKEVLTKLEWWYDELEKRPKSKMKYTTAHGILCSYMNQCDEAVRAYRESKHQDVLPFPRTMQDIEPYMVSLMCDTRKRSQREKVRMCKREWALDIEPDAKKKPPRKKKEIEKYPRTPHPARSSYRLTLPDTFEMYPARTRASVYVNFACYRVFLPEEGQYVYVPVHAIE